MKSRFVIVGFVGVAALSLGVAGFWLRSQQRAEILAASVPEKPMVESWPAEFGQRVASAEQRATNGDDAVAALGELSRLYHANGFYEEAIRCYTGLVQLDANQPVWLHRLAVILAGFGDAEGALPLWKRVIDLDPDYLAAQFKYGDLLFKQNMIAEAKAVYSAVLARAPGEGYATLGLARCEYEAGNWEAARALLEPLVAKTNYRLGYDLIVTVYEQLGLDTRAAVIRGKEKASGAYRDPPDPWMDELYEDCYDVYRLSLAAGEAQGAGNSALALRRLERALRLDPDAVSIHFQIGGTYFSMKSYSKAREHFQRCTELEPGFPDGWSQLSILLETVGDRAGADRVLAEGLENCPGSPGLHFLHARRLKAAGRLDEAIAEFRESIRLRPNEADAYIELALIYFDQKQTEAGVLEMERALEAEPGHPVVLATLALNSIINGNEEDAREWLRRASEQPRVDPEKLNGLKSAYRNKFGRDWGR